jgi:protein-tyrosine phosphatase
MKHILFVCTGNQARSPTAAGVLTKVLGEFGSDILIESAGSIAGGMPSPEPVVVAARSLGVDLSAHRSRQLTPEITGRADLILGMAREHVREVIVSDAALWAHTFTLREIVRRGWSIGPRFTHQSLDDWLEEVHRGRELRGLLGSSPDDDIEDPLGGSVDGFQRMAQEMQGLCDQLVNLIWPRARFARAD